jgi:hypothetical protein
LYASFVMERGPALFLLWFGFLKFEYMFSYLSEVC